MRDLSDATGDGRTVTSGPAYDVIEVVHVAAAVVAFGSLGATGWYAARIRQRTAPHADRALLRYFRPGTNWAERAIFLVPVLGGVLVAMGGRSIAEYAWPWIGLALWVVATGAATALIWPAEREIQKLLSAGEGGDEELHRVGKRCERGCAVASVCFVAALVIMVWQPL